MPGSCEVHVSMRLLGTFDNISHCMASINFIIEYCDKDLLAIFENGHYMMPIRTIFMSPIPKNRRILPRAWQSFRFQKITGTLKICIFSENLQIGSNENNFVITFS